MKYRWIFFFILSEMQTLNRGRPSFRQDFVKWNYWIDSSQVAHSQLWIASHKHECNFWYNLLVHGYVGFRSALWIRICYVQIKWWLSYVGPLYIAIGTKSVDCLNIINGNQVLTWSQLEYQVDPFCNTTYPGIHILYVLVFSLAYWMSQMSKRH